jgi:hypothetical protein
VYRSIKVCLRIVLKRLERVLARTYKFKYYPTRIDYIFADEKMTVKSLKALTSKIQIHPLWQNVL